MDLNELARRVEMAPSNSWDLDREIFKATGGLPDVWFGSKVINWFGDGPFGCNTEDGMRHLGCINAPNYTASLDAAASLIPDGFDWILERVNDGMTIGARVGHNDPNRISFAETPALALCAAALRARAELH